jgi:hypothetical protein
MPWWWAAEMRFRTCLGRNACREDDTGCQTCGRSHDEIAALRELTTHVALFAERMGYDNYDEFLEYLAHKAAAKIRTNRVVH